MLELGKGVFMLEKVLVEIVSGLSLLVIAQLFLHARSLDDDIKEMYSLFNRNCRFIQSANKGLSNSVAEASCSDMIIARSILLRSFSGDSYTSRFNRLY